MFHCGVLYKPQGKPEIPCRLLSVNRLFTNNSFTDGARDTPREHSSFGKKIVKLSL
jgi:hypothetical protein